MASSENTGMTVGQPNLHKQDLSKLDVTKLTALSPEVISRQATINIGTIGHVAHGKSTVVKAISGVQTVRFKNELERNITIKLEKLKFDKKGRVITCPKRLLRRRVNCEQSNLVCKNVATTNITKKRISKKNKVRYTYAREYCVEKILSQKYNFTTKSFEFLVKWEGYPEHLNSWEPLEHLKNSPLVLSQFLAERLGSQVLDTLCEKLNVSNEISDNDLLVILKVNNLNNIPNKLDLQERLLRLMIRTPKEEHFKKVEDGKMSILMYQLILRREHQLKKLKAWEDEINNLHKGQAYIKVENDVDLENPPENFTYINKYMATKGIKIPKTPKSGCNCVECGPKSKGCCGVQPRQAFTYKPSRRINVNPGAPIYECNNKCKCDENCRNRVVQNGSKASLCIFRTSNNCGWGVKTMKKILCGDFVCEYVGEVISHEEAEIRGRSYDEEGRTYLFDLDYNSEDNPYTVDAAKFGNISHFINHSCDPNLAVYAVWINCSDPNLPNLALFALRDIEPNEELTFDYMMNIDPVVPTTPEKARYLATPEKNQILEKGRNICRCEADSCRRYLF